jgi:hypothetical protein
MDVASVLAQYDAEVRANPKASPGLVLERLDGVVCLTGYFNFISWWELTPSTLRQAVASHAAHFRSRGEKLIWRVYEHNSPADISDCLAEEGFEPDAAGTLMIFDLANEVAGIDARQCRYLQGHNWRRTGRLCQGIGASVRRTGRLAAYFVSAAKKLLGCLTRPSSVWESLARRTRRIGH